MTEPTPSDSSNSVQTAIENVGTLGMTDEEIDAAVAALTDVPEYYSPVMALNRFEEEAEKDTSAVFLATRLLSHTDRGIQAERQYWNDTPSEQINEAVADCDYSFEIMGQDGDELPAFFDSSDETVLQLQLTNNTTGVTFTTEFEYPDTQLGTNNYASLIDAVNTDLLSTTNYEFIHLAGDGTEWLFYLIDSDRLSYLQSVTGDDLQFNDEPLLCDTPLSQFTTDSIPDRYIVETDNNIGNAEIVEELIEKPSSELNQNQYEPVTPNEDIESTANVLNLDEIGNDENDDTTTVTLDDDVETVIDEAEKALQDGEMEDVLTTSETDEYTPPTIDDGETDTERNERSNTDQITLEPEPDDNGSDSPRSEEKKSTAKQSREVEPENNSEGGVVSRIKRILGL